MYNVRTLRFNLNTASLPAENMALVRLPFMVELPAKCFSAEAWKRVPKRNHCEATITDHSNTADLQKNINTHKHNSEFEKA